MIPKQFTPDPGLLAGRIMLHTSYRVVAFKRFLALILEARVSCTAIPSADGFSGSTVLSRRLDDAPSRLLAEDVAAAVVLREGAMTDAEGLRRFLSNHLTPFKIPRRNMLLDEISGASTGKLQRIGLAGQPNIAE